MRIVMLLSIVSLGVVPSVSRGDASVLGAPGLLFAACTESQPRPNERRYQCPSFTASVAVEQPAEGEGAIIEQILGALKRDARLQVRTAEVSIGGARRRGLRYSASDGKGPVGVMVSVPAKSAARVRMIGCEERKPNLCDDALAALATFVQAGTWPQGKSTTPPPARPTSPRFAGRDLTVTSGCTFAVDGPKLVLKCPSAILSWVEMSPEDPPGLDWFYAPIKKAMAAQGALSERERACSIDGVATRCRDLKVARSDGKTLQMTVVEARVRGQRMLVQCNATGERARPDALPAPCDQLVNLQ